MLMQPKGRKFRKDRKGNQGKSGRIATSGYMMDKGTYGLKIMSPGRVTASQMEAVRIVVRRIIKKQGRLFFRIFPHKPVTTKPAEVRMGSGKGSPEFWVAIVEPGRIFFEIEGVEEALAKEAVRQASFKLSLETKFVKRLI